MASQKSTSDPQDATLARLACAGSELDLLKLSGDMDEDLLDASLDEYQYGSGFSQSPWSAALAK